MTKLVLIQTPGYLAERMRVMGQVARHEDDWEDSRDNRGKNKPEEYSVLERVDHPNHTLTRTAKLPPCHYLIALTRPVLPDG
jgi:hypothetical protein